ncbi:MAG: GIY-YIG nuclease family protein [Bacteroidetes bacterium]|nr:MAG: GIY-YIG nuclease family protein [Bacteroidota bacterium]TAG85725.1 MAG: GIY-YIG nuclease family protein [Bacteroidota bacterium]
MKEHNYYIYITTNPNKTVFYVGVTNNLKRRIEEHYANRGQAKTFAGRYYCYNLVYWENFKYIDKAIAREKELKGWKREKKDILINSFNPNWDFLSTEVGVSFDSSLRSDDDSSLRSDDDSSLRSE